MDVRTMIIGLTLSLLLASGVAVAADYDTGLKAYESGDFKTALADWTPLAEQGHSLSQHMLGVMYEYGYGVSESNKTAAEWYAKSAEQGFAYAQSALATLYENGDGVPKNNRRAAKWFTKSAKQGFSIAQVRLGYIYQTGKGVFKDYLRAYMWFNLAAYNGYTAINRVKDLLAKQMTPADIAKAQEMSSICLESNYTDC